MRIFNCQDIEVVKVEYYIGDFGREKERVEHFKDIQADIQEVSTPMEITLYGDRVINMLTMFSNENLEDTENMRINYEGNIYQIISKVKYSTFPPTHWVYTLEMI